MARYADSMKEAWEIADAMFGGDYEKDERASMNAGYPIYRSTAEGKFYWYICDLGARLEVNMGDKHENIWINEGKMYTANEVKAIITTANAELKEIETVRGVLGTLYKTSPVDLVEGVLNTREQELRAKLAEFGL